MANDPMSSMADMECNKLFDHIDDLLHFPDDDINKTTVDGTAFSGVWSASPHSLLNPDSVMETGCSAELAATLSIPYEDVVQMEWLSRFMEDAFGAGNTLTLDTREFPVAAAAVTPTLFQSSSPVSVLESRSSSSSSTCSSSEGGKIMPIIPENTRIKGGCGRARSKRVRPPTFNPCSAMQQISPAQSLIESHCLTKASDSSGPKRIKKSPKPSRQVEITRNVEEVGVRKCLHCGINKTPQWRGGPLGPKTLCNACGVRYKSGRLFPEYRPAASPTFVPSLHSNSHKKVLEMRTTTLDSRPPNTTSSQDLIDDAGPELFIPNKDALILLENM